jgi:hypothetical protein
MAKSASPQRLQDDLMRRAALAASVSTDPWRYQACPDRPGLLERIDNEGNRTAGTFTNGVFQPCDAATA